MDRNLLGMMVCPKCKEKIKEKNMFLICEECRLAYPVLGTVPDMLIEDAWRLNKAKKSGFKHTLKL